jgi:pimeloyl-ACP methyl ester carboxylesterase
MTTHLEIPRAAPAKSRPVDPPAPALSARRRRARIPFTTRVLALATALVGRRSPRLGSALAYRLWFRTVRPREEAAGYEWLRRARVHRVAARRPVTVYEWGSGGPAVLLIHGWGSHAARMTQFVEPLLDRGFRVVAPDLPAHGRSPGRRTDIFELADAVKAVAARLGPFDGVVAHSLGALSFLTAARRGFGVGAAVLVGPAVRLDAMVGTFAGRLGMAGGTRRALGQRVEAFLGDDFYRGLLDAAPTRCLVIHDRGDDEIPHPAGRELADALPGARLMSTDGLGHNRILADPTAVEAACRFIAGGAREGSRALAHVS